MFLLSRSDHAQKQLLNIPGRLPPSSSPCSDGVLAQDGGQARAMWHLREGITEGLRHRGARRYLPAAGTAPPPFAAGRRALACPALLGVHSVAQRDPCACHMLTPQAPSTSTTSACP